MHRSCFEGQKKRRRVEGLRMLRSCLEEKERKRVEGTRMQSSYLE